MKSASFSGGTRSRMTDAPSPSASGKVPKLPCGSAQGRAPGQISGRLASITAQSRAAASRLFADSALTATRSG